ncbi:MAG: class I SAM-dependent methyltransferase [Deltaproteobacteria bacterium]|nr:MAG: class I SAM-dependent methyltransferase [Deltaproteobacteria bacterium]
MPLSIWDGMEDCLRVITGARPRAVLDVGIGFGLWGHLLRQYLDVWSGHIQRAEWTTRIDGIEIDERRIQPHARHLYTSLHVGDMRALVPALAAATAYDVILFGDVLEHVDKPDALAVLDAAARLARDIVVVRIPMGDGWRREGREPPDHHRSQWTPDDFVPYRATIRLYDFIGNPYALVVIAAGGSAGAAHRADAAAQLAGIEQKLERIEARLVALLAPDKEDAS